MQRWKQDFIDGLRQGKPADLCARIYAGQPLVVVHAARESDPEFADAWDHAAEQAEIAASLASKRTLSPGALEALLFAQCSDDRVAGYFGMTHEELMEQVEQDDELKAVYETSRAGGQAAIQLSQFEAAMAGDKSMLTFLGKQYLGQSDKVEHSGVKGGHDGAPQKVTINNIILKTLTSDQLEAMLEQAQEIGQPLAIEGEVVE